MRARSTVHGRGFMLLTAGLFIVVPDIFLDYDLNAVRDLQSELTSASFIVKVNGETSSWKY